MPTVTYPITNTGDDVYVFPTITTAVQNQFPVTGSQNAIARYAGLRFLPTHNLVGMVASEAFIDVVRDDGNSVAGTAYGFLAGVAHDNAPTWSTDFSPNTVPKTASRTALTHSATQKIDVTAQVNAIISRPGYASGNAIAFVGDPEGADGLIAWKDFSNASGIAQLTIIYSTGSPDETPPTINSSASPSVMEGVALSHALTANEAVTWTKVGGANAALFTLTGANLSLAAQTAPAGPFEVIVRATDAAGNWSEQTITVTVTQAPLIRFIGESVGTTSATIKPHQSGDLIVAFAFRDGSATLPTLPTGQDWASALAPTGANTCSMRLAAKIADSSSEATGTFTSATSLIVHVYRPRPGVTLSIGAAASASGASTTVSFPALALQDPSGNSYVAGFAGSRSVNTTLESPPTGMVNRSTVVDATDEAAGHDTNGGVTSWSLTTKAVGGTSSGWWGATVEIKATGAAPAAKPFAWSFLIG